MSISMRTGTQQLRRARSVPTTAGCKACCFWIAQGGKTRFIDTGCYVATHVAIAPDHSIWTLGVQRDAGSQRLSAPLLISEGIIPPGAAELGRVGIMVTADRVGILADSGKVGSDLEWVELDLSGNLRDRLRTTQDLGAEIALTQDRQFLTLDTASHAWQSIPNQGAILMGADANNLVYRKSSTGPIQLQWFNRPGLIGP